jgi:hypothetical protein
MSVKSSPVWKVENLVGLFDLFVVEQSRWCSGTIASSGIEDGGSSPVKILIFLKRKVAASELQRFRKFLPHLRFCVF